ncbi:hypothetical protein C5167_021043 [Papaver somniferum]|uniref:Gnk2-homologous domain-containing protein n=1 Tax=Papaver somniferum TaxID=3469 RepID=A0A4Y7IY30_PAPSO|nr:uncharacterized protein LOC113354434 [Papaver somniferum]RZC52621.1 hypothetical protein C5167_021043 [Papaver somniferum]
MAGSRSCRRIALILVAFFFASNIFICNGKVQFTCTYTNTKVLNRIDLDYDLVHYRSRQLIAAGYILLSKPNALEYKFVRDHATIAAIQGPCYDPIDCNRICSQLANSRADIYTGNKGNCAYDDTIKESLCTCCVP